MQFQRDYVQCCLKAKLLGKIQVYRLDPMALDLVFADGTIATMDLEFSQGFYSKSQPILEKWGGKNLFKVYNLLSDLAEEMWKTGLDSNRYK